MTPAELVALARGTRVRDTRTGATGTTDGTAYVPAGTPGGGGRTLPVIRWDGSDNATPWGWSTAALEVDRAEPSTRYCAASGLQPGDDGATHHLVPRAGTMRCTYCKRTEAELREGDR